MLYLSGVKLYSCEHLKSGFHTTFLEGKNMSGKKMILRILLLLICLPAIAAENVEVSLGVNNVPPSLSELTLTCNENTINLTFLVEDSNTLGDIQTLVITFYEMGPKGFSTRKYTWEGLNTEFSPKPLHSLVPSLDQHRLKNFRFSLEIARGCFDSLIVVVWVGDSKQNHTQLSYTYDFGTQHD